MTEPRMAGSPTATEDTFLVGLGYGHHAGRSGYSLFRRHVGITLKSPVRFRYLPFRRIDEIVSRLAGRKSYPLGVLIAEAAAAAHMLLFRAGLYHFLYGDTDLWLLGKIRRPAGTRLVATFHEPTESLERMKMDPALLQSLDAAILLSESQRPFFLNYLPGERVFVIPHGVDTQFFHPPDRYAGEPVCITVGEHHRDFDTLSRAIELIHQRRPNVRFIVVGASVKHPSPPFRHPAVEFLRGISDEELVRMYQTSRVAVFCFKHATASNALLEAMACGLGIVATDLDAVREYLGPRAGLLCPPEDPRAVADGVDHLLSDDARARQLGSNARRRAEDCCYQRVAEQHVRVYSIVRESKRQA